jgi:hypothetical protein
MLVLVIGNVGNFWIIMQEGIAVRVYSVDYCILHLHYKVFLRPPIEECGISVLRFFYVKCSCGAMEQKKLIADKL